MVAFVQVWRPDAWGYSFTDGQPVIARIGERVPYTLELMGSSSILAVVIAAPVGIPGASAPVQLDGRRSSRSRDHRGYAMPTFWLGTQPQKYIFAFKLDLFPASTVAR